MKKSVKHLSLTKETLRYLNKDQMSEADGGATTSCDITACRTCLSGCSNCTA
jgi:hypothetical protein